MQPEGCPIWMSDNEPCGRPIYAVSTDCDKRPVCLMHSFDPKKSQSAFDMEIEAIFSGTSKHHRPNSFFDCRRFVFLDLNFERILFTKSVDFDEATFTKRADFADKVFRAAARFYNATFTKGAIFSSVTFAEGADFCMATFTEGAHFNRATFTKCADFRKATFTKRADFGTVVFTEDALFNKATFTEDVDFSVTTFTRNADFSGMTFTMAADFGGATFIKSAGFTSVTFTKGAHFFRTTFKEAAHFTWATFTKRADFRGATFTDSADFNKATFTEAAEFTWATFTKSVCFHEAIFTPCAQFIKATFIKDVDFTKSTFIKGANFGNAFFCDAVSFDNVTFGAVNGLAEPVVDFRGASFLKPDLVRFLRTNKASSSGLRARFANCRFEGVQFEDVRWYRDKNRVVLQDELDILEQAETCPSYEEVAVAYRRLITNFERARAYDLSDECTVGEFEMKRRNPDRFLFAGWLNPVYERFPRLRTWVGEQVSIIGIYRLASVYGTSYHRALIVLGGLLVVFGVGYSTIAEIRPVNVDKEPIAEIRSVNVNKEAMERIRTCDHVNRLDALCSGILHSLETATLQRTTLYQPVSAFGFIVEIFEQILVAGQAALLLFALRRRFRR